MHFIKKILKTILIILIIALIGFCGYRYYKLKNEGKLEKVFAKNQTNLKNSSYNAQFISKETSDSKEITKEKNENKKESSDGEFIVEKKNYDDYYNEFNFDARLLLYEGKQHSNTAKEVFDILIEDANDPLFSKPTIIFDNFYGLKTNKITSNNLEEYKAVLETAKNIIGDSACSFTFGYNDFKTYVNKITIIKH